VIEDDAELLVGLRDNLEMEGYEVVTATDGEEGLAKAISACPSAMILDLMLPKMNGFEVCRALGERGLSIPTIILTARSQETDKVLGLELGADDYITKPFSVRELLARLRAVIRRADGSSRTGERCRFGDVELDFRHRLARRAGRPLILSDLEWEVLRYLVARRGQAVSREELLSDVWGFRSFPTTRSVDNLIARLRQKVEVEPHRPRHILTVHGKGYRFVD